MTNQELKKYVGRTCQIMPSNLGYWINGRITAVYSEIISFNGYPYNRDGLKIRELKDK